ncbi:MAG: hypothetical protein SFV32_08535 [Opitutaceae bacterium]|nr:hypothetical protein [Opitutaceae bacterium]
MKTVLTSLVCLAGLLATADAQVLSERAARNVLIGGVAGAIIGENNDRALEGALIGAAAGAVWTAATEPGTYHTVSHYESRDYGRNYGRHHGRRHHGSDVVIIKPDHGRRVIVRDCDRPDRIVIDRDYDRRVIIRDRDCDTRVIVRQRPVIIRDGGCDGKVIVVNRDHGSRIVINGREDRHVDYYADSRPRHRGERRVIYEGSRATYVQED